MLSNDDTYINPELYFQQDEINSLREFVLANEHGILRDQINNINNVIMKMLQRNK